VIPSTRPRDDLGSDGSSGRTTGLRARTSHYCSTSGLVGSRQPAVAPTTWCGGGAPAARGGGIPTARSVTQPTSVEVEAAVADPERRGLRRGSGLVGGAEWVVVLRARDRASVLAGRLYACWLRCGGERRRRCGGHTAEMWWRLRVAGEQRRNRRGERVMGKKWAPNTICYGR
jgi:hypothetical protein